jgi:HD-GYP domain-containing protein (c-di-GMP phosphodiesterase class II)
MADLRLLVDMHDIGKLGVPDHILLKPGPLTEEERKKIQRHPEVGYRIALSSGELAGVAPYILQHHERSRKDLTSSRLSFIFYCYCRSIKLML